MIHVLRLCYTHFMKKGIIFVLFAGIALSACARPQQPLTSGVTGAVRLGPTCPVERIPPDPLCAPKPYQAQFVLTIKNSNQIIKQFSSDSLGKFTFALPSGNYTISPVPSSKMLPRCASQTFTVKQNSYASILILCDTGIR